MYIVAKEQYLATLLNEGTISPDEFDKIDRFLYERFHIKGRSTNALSTARSDIAAMAPTPAPIKSKAGKRTPQETPAKEISEPAAAQPIEYISLTESTRSCTKDSPAHVIQSRKRNRNTLEFLGLWESAHNPYFSHEGYISLMEKQKAGSFDVTPKQWIDQTNSFGMTSKQEKMAGPMYIP